MNSWRRRCSSRETSQKLTITSTPTATKAVIASISSLLTGAMSITSVASAQVTSVAPSAASTPSPSGRL